MGASNTSTNTINERKFCCWSSKDENQINVDTTSTNNSNNIVNSKLPIKQGDTNNNDNSNFNPYLDYADYIENFNQSNNLVIAGQKASTKNLANLKNIKSIKEGHMKDKNNYDNLYCESNFSNISNIEHKENKTENNELKRVATAMFIIEKHPPQHKEGGSNQVLNNENTDDQQDKHG